MTLKEVNNKNRKKYFDAIILAGERKKDSPLLRRVNVPAKAFIKVGGIPMILRVVTTLLSSDFVKKIYLCGQDQELFRQINQIAKLIDQEKIIWIDSEKGPSLSTYKALKASGGKRPVLLTTCDHALLTPEHVNFFCKRALEIQTDLAIALAKLEYIKGTFPQVKRTYYTFKEGKFCSCNLFSFMNKRAFQAATFWQTVEAQRKNPLKIIKRFGYTWALLYSIGQLTLSKALERASQVIGCKAEAVTMHFPEVAIDVDTYEDLLLVEKIAGEYKKS